MFCYPFNQSAVGELVMLTKPASTCCPTSISWSTWFLPTSQDQMGPLVFVISEVVTFRNGATTSLGCTTGDYTISEKLIRRCDTEKSQGQSLYDQTIIFKIWPRSCLIPIMCPSWECLNLWGIWDPLIVLLCFPCNVLRVPWVAFFWPYVGWTSLLL